VEGSGGSPPAAAHTALEGGGEGEALQVLGEGVACGVALLNVAMGGGRGGGVRLLAGVLAPGPAGGIHMGQGQPVVAEKQVLRPETLGMAVQFLAEALVEGGQGTQRWKDAKAGRRGIMCHAAQKRLEAGAGGSQAIMRKHGHGQKPRWRLLHEFCECPCNGRLSIAHGRQHLHVREAVLESSLELKGVEEEGGAFRRPDAAVFGSALEGAEGDNEAAHEELAKKPGEGEDVFVGEELS